MAFIPIDKMRQLREAARNGDPRAKKILRAQLDGSDYSSDLDSYFAPTPEPAQEPERGVSFSMSTKQLGSSAGTGNPKLDEWLRSNGIKDTDEDYEEALDEYYMEFPNERPAQEQVSVQEVEQGTVSAPDVEEEIDMTKEMAQGIIELISKCDQTMLQIMQNESIDDTARKGAMTSLQEIKQALFDAADKVKKIKQSLDKKVETEVV